MNQNDFMIENGILIKYVGECGDVVIPKGVMGIGEHAFENNKFLRSVTIGDHVQSIGDYAFCNCECLQSVFIGDGVTKIGKGAFSWSDKLRRLTIGKNVCKIGEEAFLIDGNIQEIHCPDGLLNLNHFMRRGFYAFELFPFHTVLCNWKCFQEYSIETCLGELIEPEYTDFEYYLKDVTVQEIYFLENKNLITWKNVREWIEVLQKYGNVECIAELLRYSFEDRFDENGEENVFQIKDGVLIAYTGWDENVVIPENVTSIYDRAFHHCQFLQSVTIGDQVKTIGEKVFRDCPNLNQVILGRGVTNIGNLAFYCGREIRDFQFYGEPPIPNEGEIFGYDCFFVFHHSAIFSEQMVQHYIDEIVNNTEYYKRRNDYSDEHSYICHFLKRMTVRDLLFLEEKQVVTWDIAEVWLSIMKKYKNTECLLELQRYIFKYFVLERCKNVDFSDD